MEIITVRPGRWHGPYHSCPSFIHLVFIEHLQLFRLVLSYEHTVVNKTDKVIITFYKGNLPIVYPSRTQVFGFPSCVLSVILTVTISLVEYL